MDIKNLTIGSHNIQGGAMTKLSQVEVKNVIMNHDIYCIQESWLDNRNGDDDICINIPGYRVYRSVRAKGKKKRIFGGNLVFIKEQYEGKHGKK